MLRILVACAGLGTLLACSPGESLSSECQNDLERCSDEGDAVERCIDSRWEAWTDCDDACELSEGVAECVSGEVSQSGGDDDQDTQSDQP